MSENKLRRSMIAGYFLKTTPPLIRERLLHDPGFRKETGVVTDATFAFLRSSFSFSRNRLYATCREALRNGERVELFDDQNQAWSVAIESDDGEDTCLAISRDSHLFRLAEFFVFSPDPAKRVSCLLKVASDVNLPQVSCDQWKEILERQAFEDDEFDSFQEDIRETPVQFTSSICRLFNTSSANISASSLVPDSLRYFERLVGPYDGSHTILDYVETTAKGFFANLLDWSASEGLLYSLLLASHSSLSAAIHVEQIETHDLLCAFDFLETEGDPVSRLGAVELGLSILHDRPQLAPRLLSLAQTFLQEDKQENSCDYNLFSSLFILVDGELATKRLMVNKPPFYRRLAALAHAALLYRQVAQSQINCNEFSNWALNHGRETFYLQTFLDMRLEPRWNPGMASMRQLKAEFLGRILMSAHNASGLLSEGPLRSFFFDNQPALLMNVMSDFRSFLPGPIDGGVASTQMPDKVVQLIEDQLQSGKNCYTAESFMLLVCGARLFHISWSHADLAHNALSKCNSTLSGLLDGCNLFEIVYGLAHVAATSRHEPLAFDVQKLVFRYRHDQKFRLSIDEATQILLVASAAHKDTKEWLRYMGMWLTDLAFGPLIDNEVIELRSLLSTLLHLDPSLWISCSKAEAALQSLS